MSEIDPPHDSEVDPPREKVSLHELAWTFNHIALASFGGGLSAWSREVLVVEKQWMGEAEFLSAMTMCRILPGSTQVNVAVFAGSKMRRLLGAAAALFGLCLMPVLLFAAAFVLSGLVRWPLPVVLAIVAPIGPVWAWPKKRPA
jgi:chromate transporter